MLTGSVAFSTMIVVLAFALLIFLTIKGVPMWVNAVLATMVVGISTPEGPLGILLGTFSDGVGMIVTNLGIVYIIGMIFADAMTASGCGETIGTFLVDKLSIKAAPFCIMIPTLLLSLGGIDSYPFIMAPITFAVLKRANLPRTVAVVVLCGTYTLIGFLMPGSTGMINVLASNLFGTNLFAGADIGIIMFVVGLVLNALYYIYMCHDYRKKGIGYTPTPLEEEAAANRAEGDKPNFILALIPLLIAFCGSFFFQLYLGFNSAMTAVCSQGLAAVFVYITNWKRMNAFGGSKLKQIGNSMQKVFTFIMLAAILMGFSQALGTTAMYGSLAGVLSGLKGNAYLITVISCMILVFLTGAGMTALTIFAPSIGSTLIASGANAGVMHRLAMAACTTFDSTPWSVSVILNFQVMDVKLKEGYGRVVMVQIVITTIYTLVGLLAALLLH